MIEVEQGIIGCVLVDPDSLFSIYNKLKPEMFEDDFCRDAYNAILGMYDLGQDITIPTLAEKLESESLPKNEVVASLRYCFEVTPTSTEIGGYARSIINEYKVREVKNIFQKAKLAPKSIEITIGEMLTRLEELNQNQNVPFVSLKEIVENSKDKYFNENVGQGLIRTGFYKLDDCLGGLEGGDVTVIGARPAVGKSALVTQIIGNVAKRGKRVGYFNLEMNENQVYERFIAKTSGIDLVRLRRAKAFLGGEKELFEKANAEVEKYDVTISTGGKTVSEIRAISRHQKFDLIVIDYLQLIKADRKYASRASEVGDISKAVKALAMELKVPIILLSQLNRTSARLEDKEPDMSELRESGDIEQDASNIILLWNLSEDVKRYKGLKIEKQRQGELMKEALTFDGQYMTFDECNDELWKVQKMIREQKGRNSGGYYEDDDSPF